MIFWSFLGFLLIGWIAVLQRNHLRERVTRLERQRRQSVGRAPIPGAHQDPDEEEQRLLAILQERKEKGES